MLDWSICVQCGDKISDEHLFCTKCGEPIKGETVPPPLEDLIPKTKGLANKQRIAIVIPVLIILFTAGYFISAMPENIFTQQSESVSTQPTEGRALSPTKVCDAVTEARDSFYEAYNKYLESELLPEELDEAVDYSSGVLVLIADEIYYEGIDWDATEIVYSLIMGAADGILDLHRGIMRNYFSPNRDFAQIASEIDQNITAVLSSSCSQ
jgi:hypothetical protein